MDVERVPVLGSVPEFTALSFDIPVEPVEVPGGVMVTAPGASAERGHLLYVHGGGFESRMPALMHRAGYEFSRVTGRPVLVCYYRLAPAHRFPAPVQDVLVAYRYLLGWGGDIRVIGESSGAALVFSALFAPRPSSTTPSGSRRKPMNRAGVPRRAAPARRCGCRSTRTWCMSSRPPSSSPATRSASTCSAPSRTSARRETTRETQ